MEFDVQFLSFFVIQTDGESADSGKRFKHFQTMDGEDYEDSPLKDFLTGEFARIVKRKAERNPASESVPTKIGRFRVEPGYELDSNPDYNLLQRLRSAEDAERFHSIADELVRIYMDTSAVRGGALIAVQATLSKLFDQPFLFILKCDFEPKIARIADERSLISTVEMAISARSMKSILYPHMPEEGMMDSWEVKLHQASHARYFEDFLKFVSYERPLPEVMGEQVLEMVQQYMEDKWQDDQGHLRKEEEEAVEIWAASDKRELLERWTPEQVFAASAVLVEQKEDLALSFKLGGVQVKGLLSDFGKSLHFARHNGRYVAVLEGDFFQFERGISPVELIHPPELEEVMKVIGAEESGTAVPEGDGAAGQAQAAASAEDDDVPW
ncbi:MULTISPECIES: DUF3900 domain-containing protein [unclassified Paenibacillus]|uniref:DUF3900 domain-containing protein n=1 Tax=unclassified Paenibacillus TaxID=185978 RepID=UPI0009568E7A|nr:MULTISPECIES: DUF3900 domain-containing protein [unclassified Paenibacillus]ASS65597.1 DUF3900 domain-containing protein [Paenibacillus sp. RUD330]SIQ30401.1 protein of unknown function [Paenibacillus sp. RU4X]SIQ52234.1 protein of unknown function [Paenibacillus sp. RU4T]